MLRTTYLREFVLNAESLVHIPVLTIDPAALMDYIKVAHSVDPLATRKLHRTPTPSILLLRRFHHTRAPPSCTPQPLLALTLHQLVAMSTPVILATLAVTTAPLEPFDSHLANPADDSRTPFVAPPPLPELASPGLT